MREVVVGETLDQYELGELLARSGMASIFKAKDTATGETVVLKIPHPQYESDVVFFERFRREEQLGLRLDHPYIIKMRKPRAKSRMYMAMEYIDGRSLRAEIQAKRALPTERALEIARQVVEALVYLHANGVVHRDVKPENILLVGEHGLKLLDFGIALDESARRLTWTGLSATLGTPDYMAPEQVGGRRGDARTDVYSAGMLLYEMLTGDLPYPAQSAQALMRAKTTEEPRPPSYHMPTIDPSLEAVIMKAIARAPRDRQETAAELLADLRDPAAAASRAPDGEQARARSMARPLRRLAFPAFVVSIVLGLSTLVWLSQRAPSPSAPPAARER